MDLHVILSLMIVADLLWWFRADARLRRLRRTKLLALCRGLLGLFAAGQAVYLALWLCMSAWLRGGGNSVPLPLHVSVYLWHVLVLPVLCLFMLGSMLRSLARRRSARSGRVATTGGDGTRVPAHVLDAGVVSVGEKAHANADGPPSSLAPSRRQVIAAAAVALPPLVTAAVTARAVVQLGEFRVRDVGLAVAGLPPDLHGLTVAVVTDLHLGKFTRNGIAGRVAAATNALSTDLVVFLGDLIDYSQDDLPAGIEFIRGLAPRHGPKCLVMIEGNHDLLEYGPGFEQKIRDADLPLLVDEARSIQVPGRRTPVQCLGMCWGRPDADKDGRLEMTEESIAASMDRVLRLRRPDAFPILLTHHPHAFDPAAAAGLPLTLAGHTHGGQLMLTDHIGAGPLRFRYWTGLYRKAASQLFVCNGVGNWFPLRVNAPAEVVRLTLNRA